MLVYLYYIRLRWALSWWFAKDKDVCFINRSYKIRKFMIKGNNYPAVYYPKNDRVLPTQSPERLFFEDCDLTTWFNPGMFQVYTKFISIQGYERRPDLPIHVDWTKFPFLEELHIVVTTIDLNKLRPCKYLKTVYVDDISKHVIPEFLQGKVKIRGKTDYSEGHADPSTWESGKDSQIYKSVYNHKLGGMYSMLVHVPPKKKTS